MEEGYLFTTPYFSDLIWKGGKTLKNTGGIDGIEMMLSGRMHFYHKAYRCRICKLVLFNYHEDKKTALEIIHSGKKQE